MSALSKDEEFTLLAKIAATAGIPLDWRAWPTSSPIRADTTEDFCYDCNDGPWWNPLLDNADAFELIALFGLSPSVFRTAKKALTASDVVMVTGTMLSHEELFISEPLGDDAEAALRLAVCRAVAAYPLLKDPS